MSDLIEFRNLGISEITLEALKRKGFEEPSPIQAQTIPILLEGKVDMIGQAQTGTGKTAAFGIPVIETVKANSRRPQALILAPTRELSMQIAEELNSLKGDRPVRIAAFYGGQPIDIQLDKLKSGIDIVIGTPGRVIDLMKRGKLVWDELQFAILDEADEMLNMGFVEDIELILAQTPPEKRMLMFSATMPNEIKAIAERFMRPDYQIVCTKTDLSQASLTEQIYFEVRREDKLEALSRIIDLEDDIYAMVFCRTRNDVDELVVKLQSQGYPVEALHGDIAQAQRTKVIARFKKREFRILIATDVAARGIDVNDLTHVINYSIPQGTESYVHRIGRTGRAGKTGTAITFVTPAEYRRLIRIRNEANTDIRKGSLPQAKEIIEAKKQRYVEKLASVVEAGEHNDYLSFAEELLAISEHPAEIFAAMLRLKFKKELLENSYNQLGGRSEHADPDGRGKARVFIGLGKLDSYGASRLVDLICTRTGIKRYMVGKIDCFDKFSFVTVRYHDAERIVEAFRNGRTKVEMAKPEDETDERRERPERGERPERFEKTERTEKPAKKRRKETVSAPNSAPVAAPVAAPTPAPADELAAQPKAKRKMREWIQEIEAVPPVTENAPRKKAAPKKKK